MYNDKTLAHVKNAALPPLDKHVVPELLAAGFNCDMSLKRVLAASGVLRSRNIGCFNHVAVQHSSTAHPRHTITLSHGRRRFVLGCR